MSKVSELNKLALKLTGENPYKKTIKESLDVIATFLAGEEIDSENIEDAIQKCTEYYSGGGEGFPPNWSEIGYSTTPQATINGFNYAKTIQQNWDGAITTMYSKYSDDSNLMFFPLVDTSNVTTLFKAFFNCANLQMVAKINTTRLNNMNQTFYNCTSIYSVPLFDTGEVTTLNACFSGCAKLVEVPQFDTSHLTTTGLKNTFYNCTSLSDTSLNNIMAMCINATGTGSSYKTLKSCGLTSDQATRCQSLSNYADFIAAGWTTGY